MSPKIRTQATWLSTILLIAAFFASIGGSVATSTSTGKIAGKLIMSENGRPLPGALVTLIRRDDDDLLVKGQASVESKEDGTFELNGLPVGTYDLEVTAKAHSLPTGRKAVITDAKTSQLDLQLNPSSRYMNLYASRRVFLPDDKPFVQVSGFSDASALNLKIWKITTDQLVNSGDVYYAVSNTVNTSNGRVAPWKLLKHEIKGRDAEGTFENTIELDPFAPGIYVLESSPVYAGDAVNGKEAKDSARNEINLTRRAMFYVSQIGLVTKSTPDEINAYVTDLKTGEPVEGVGLSLVMEKKKETIAASGPNGLKTFRLSKQQQEQRNLALIATQGDSVAVSTIRQYGEGDDNFRDHFILDRPVYRPGDLVQFRYILRKVDGDNLSVPPSTAVRFELRNADGEKMGTTTGSTSRFGTSTGELKLPDGDARPFQILAFHGNEEGSTYVEVMAYRKPEFEIKVEPLKPFYLTGDRVEVKVKCTYFFGGPVIGAKISGIIEAADLYRWSYPDEEISESYSSSGEYVGDIPEVTTNDQGEAVLSYNTKDLAASPFSSGDRRIRFNVTATEDEARYFEGAGTVDVYQGNLDLSLDSSQWVIDPGTEGTFSVQIKTRDERPAANQKVKVEFGTEVWHRNVQESVFAKAGEKVVVTDAEGAAQFTVPASREGDLSVRVSTIDSTGRTVRASTYVWVNNGSGSWDSGDDSMKIALDKSEYVMGETATAYVRAPSGISHVWMTSESNGVIEQQVVKIEKGQGTFRFKVPATSAPNAFVSATTIKNRKLIDRSRSYKISLNQKQLNVEVTSKQKKLKPGEVATFTIRASNPDGSPAQSELSLGLVDESIYAIQEDTDEPMDSFYPRIWSAVNTSYSFPEVYLDGGDKADSKRKQGDEPRTRKDFKDTAKWFGQVTTDAAGKAELTIRLPDNITSWRATAVALTADSKFGKAKGNVIASLPLMVRLQAPMSLTQFDKVWVNAIVTNGSDRRLTGSASLVATGAGAGKSEDFQFDLEAGRTANIRALVDVQTAGGVILKAVAKSNDGEGDAMEQSVRAVPHGIEAVQTFNKRLMPDEPIALPFEPIAKQATGSWSVSGSTSRLQSLVTSLDQLVDYPYGCVEQTMSRFGPAVSVLRAMRALETPNRDLEAKIEEVARQSITRLQQMQHTDGGFGWWENDESNSRMTAIVLDGLAEANLAGMGAPEVMVRRALDWAKNALKNRPAQATFSSASMPALAAAVLAYEPNAEAARLLASWRPEQYSGAMDYADVALGLARVGSQTSKRLAKDHALEAVKQQKESTRYHWFGVAPMARSIEALLMVEPEAPEIDEWSEQLVQSRRGFGWQSTFDTGTAVRALAKLAASRGEGGNTGSVELISQGNVFAMLQLEPSQSAPSTRKFSLDELRQHEETEVRALVNPVYFASEVRAFNVLQEIPAEVSQKLKIERRFFRLVPGRTKEGRPSLVTDGSPTNKAATGTTLRCLVEVTANENIPYVMVEVPLPSNVRVTELESVETWNYWYSDRQFLDDKVVFFVTMLEKGTHSFDFHVRTEAEGIAALLPARVSPMYVPAEAAWCKSSRLEVTK